MNDFNSLDELLDYSCEDLQLSVKDHTDADRAYNAVGAWLSAPESELHRYNPTIYPQGSFRIGTVVRPIGSNEYDLDFVCEMQGMNWSHIPAIDVLNAVERRLRDHGTYHSMVERKNRCIRLTYANQFHMDILPAAPEIPPNGTCIRVPDRDLKDWKASNPKGYAAWFESRSRLYSERLKEMRIEPMPQAEKADEKMPLQRAIQLIKRARDRYYLRHPKNAPCSIVITTLAAQAYTGTVSTAQTVHDILAALSANTALTEVRNPANIKEILSEQWNKNPTTFTEFRAWVQHFGTKWDEAIKSHGTDLSTKLSELFGDDVVKAAYLKQAGRVGVLRSAGGLGVNRAGTLVGTSVLSGAVVVPKNTFYGE